MKKTNNWRLFLNISKKRNSFSAGEVEKKGFRFSHFICCVIRKDVGKT